MASAAQQQIVFSDINSAELVAILSNLTDAIAVHDVICDPWGVVIDASLLWWNNSYQNVRFHEVAVGDLLMETYVEPDCALGHVNEAWSTGHSLQVFHIGQDTKTHYTSSDADVEIWVTWQRLGDHIVETACSVDEVLALREFARDQQSLVAVASRKRAMAVERERIARNLHDVVIQNLYATSLTLSIAGKRHGMDVEKDFNAAIDSLDRIIGEIRCEILAVESQKASRLRLQIEDALIPILHPTHADFELSVEVPTLPVDVQSHVRAVCLEATSNAVRHGGASHIRIRLSRHGDQLVLTVSDNGSGIPESSQQQNGLQNMRERAQTLGGNMEIQTSADNGTLISWSIPYPRWQS